MGHRQAPARDDESWLREVGAARDLGLQEDGVAVGPINIQPPAEHPVVVAPSQPTGEAPVTSWPAESDANGDGKAQAAAGFVHERQRVDAAHAVGEA